MIDYYVYLMCDGCNYKIGKSKDPNIRLNQLATANPNIRLLAYSDKVSEKNLHKLFESKRLFTPSGSKSEWFDLSDDDVAIILDSFATGEFGSQDVDEQFRGNILWGGGKEAKLHGKYHWGNRVKGMHRFKINFGKHKGKKLTAMQSEEEIRYIQYFIKEFMKKPRPEWLHGEWAGHVYSRFCWWIGELRIKDYRAIKKYFDDGVDE